MHPEPRASLGWPPSTQSFLEDGQMHLSQTELKGHTILTSSTKFMGVV
jgi:hypothetical protein